MIYPQLPAPLDLGVTRINGAGLGNCLFPYFHAVVAARQYDQRVITPAWRSIAVNPVLRGDGTIRRYHRMLKSHADEIAGPAKVAALALRPIAAVREVGPDRPLPPIGGPLTILRVRGFTFAGLGKDRAMLRARLAAILRAPDPAANEDRYAAMHVRLGDFAAADAVRLATGNTDNMRLPLEWFSAVAMRIRALAPDLPIRVYSDGTNTELAALLQVPGVVRARGGDDANELVALSGAALLVGSHSTFSRWAAFLGGMPVIWRAGTGMAESPSPAGIRIYHVGDDVAAEIADLT